VVPAEAELETLTLNVHDDVRRRDIHVRIVLRRGASRVAPPAPVVLFSHGLGGTCRTSEYLAAHWAARGYAAVFPQHPGSDDEVWKNLPVPQQREAVTRAANAANAQDRVLDIHIILDQLDRWTISEDHPLSGRLDLSAVGMSGHSFGAVTTQTLSGQTHRLPDQGIGDPRIRAAIAMSPSVPAGGDLATAFGSVRIPWLMMTGSKDHSPIGHMPPEVRRDVFNHLPKTIDRYELVLGGAHHFAFTDNELPREIPARNPNHHPSILRISTAYWDAYLRGEPAAKRWLQSTSIRATLDPGDRWRIGIAEP
jgi:predicted dienelactone hydrolase